MVQHNDIFIDKIMLHWESEGSLRIGVCDWGCTTYLGENVQSLWHVENKGAKKKLKEKKLWVAFLYVYNMRHHDPYVHYQKEAQCYIVTWLHNNFAMLAMTHYYLPMKVKDFGSLF